MKLKLLLYGEAADLSKADLWSRQFYASVVPDASSRERMIYGEITSLKSTLDIYTLVHVTFIEVYFFLLFKFKRYIKMTDISCHDALMTYIIDMIFTVGIHT